MLPITYKGEMTKYQVYINYAINKLMLEMWEVRKWNYGKVTLTLELDVTQ